MFPQSADHGCKYQVRKSFDGWRLERADDCLGVFAEAAEAVDQACRAARADAARGRVGIVTAETSPREFHCFMPAPGLRENSAAPATPAPARYLKLVV